MGKMRSQGAGAAPVALVTRGQDGVQLSETASVLATARSILEEAQSAALSCDIRGEQAAVARAYNYVRGAAGNKVLKGLEREIDALVSTGKLLIGSEQIGIVQPEGWLSQNARTAKFIGRGGQAIYVRSDRVLQDEIAYPLDRHTSSNVVLDGREQITQRPTLTRMLLLAPLPGSALVGGLAMQKQTKHDSRQADFIVASADWSLIVPVNPNELSGPRQMAERINAIADRFKAQSTSTSQDIPAPSRSGDELDQLVRIQELLNSGILSPDEAKQMKDRVLGQS